MVFRRDGRDDGRPPPEEGGAQQREVRSFMRALFASLVAMACVAILLGVSGAGEEGKYKTKEVMKAIMASKLGPKVFAGQGTKEENKKVLDYFIELHKNMPPKGDKDAWAKVTQTLVDTAKKIEAGEEKGSAKLAKLINCQGCHTEFKKKKGE
jgi:hypothetical protein